MDNRFNKCGVYVAPLGGCGEIGMNLTLVGVGDTWMAIDCGLMFPNSQHVGVDFIVPSLDFLEENGIKISAWLITHAHEDHIGGLAWLFKDNKAPIYGANLTINFLKEKFIEANIVNNNYFHYVQPNEKIKINDVSVVAVAMEHSIPDSCAFLIQTNQGNLFFSGDFKSSDFRSLKLPYSVKALFADSTNALVAGKDKEEQELIQNFIDLFNETKGRVVIILFASSLRRYKTIMEASKKAKRYLFLLGKSLNRNIELAKGTGFFNTEEVDVVINEEEFSQLRANQLCVLAAGSQGEIFSGASRLAYKHVSQIRLTGDDVVVFSSRTIPGNEKAVNNLLNEFARQGVKVVNSEGHKYHVSGHGFEEDLKDLIVELSPDYFVPIHGEYRQLARHKQIAIECGVDSHKCFLIENGTILEFKDNKIKKMDYKFPSEKKIICEGILSDLRIAKERSKLAKSGVIIISISKPKGEHGHLAIDVQQLGVPVEKKRIMGILGSILGKKANTQKKYGNDELAQSLKREIARMFHGYKPQIFVTGLE